MLNVWKVTTLALAGALAIVVGRGAVQQASACDDVDLPSAEQITRLRLARGIAFLERAEQEVEAASAARAKDRANALAQIAKAKASLELALAPVETPLPKPKPKPLPRKRVVADPFTTVSTVPAKTQVVVVNPFLRASVPQRPVRDTRVLDPWSDHAKR